MLLENFDNVIVSVVIKATCQIPASVAITEIIKIKLYVYDSLLL